VSSGSGLGRSFKNTAEVPESAAAVIVRLDLCPFASQETTARGWGKRRSGMLGPWKGMSCTISSFRHGVLAGDSGGDVNMRHWREYRVPATHPRSCQNEQPELRGVGLLASLLAGLHNFHTGRPWSIRFPRGKSSILRPLARAVQDLRPLGYRSRPAVQSAIWVILRESTVGYPRGRE
jgi:hypothetical protein